MPGHGALPARPGWRVEGPVVRDLSCRRRLRERPRLLDPMRKAQSAVFPGGFAVAGLCINPAPAMKKPSTSGA